MSRTFVGGLAAALAAALALTGCSSSAASTPSSAPATLTVVTHDSFNVSPDLLASFEKSSGLKVTYVAPGDAGRS
ncbi:hypothetical protein [Propioniciclava flava]